MRVWGPPHIHWGYSPHCHHKRLLVTDRYGEADEGPPIEPEVGPDPNADPYWSNVVLLVGSEDGTNKDESWTKPKGNGGGAVSTTNAKWGTKSVDPWLGPPNYNGGGSDATDDFNLSPNQMSEFTIEAWIYLPNTINDVQIICGKSFMSIAWVFCLNATALRFSYQVLESGFGGNGNFTNLVTPLNLIVGKQWYYVAVDKDAAKNFRLYIDGVMKLKYTPNDATIGNFWLESLEIGRTGLFGTNGFTGQIDELRITKGQARYKTDTSYPVPTGPFPRPHPPTARTENAKGQESQTQT